MDWTAAHYPPPHLKYSYIILNHYNNINIILCIGTFEFCDFGFKWLLGPRMRACSCRNISFERKSMLKLLVMKWTVVNTTLVVRIFIDIICIYTNSTNLTLIVLSVITNVCLGCVYVCMWVSRPLYTFGSIENDMLAVISMSKLPTLDWSLLHALIVQRFHFAFAFRIFDFAEIWKIVVASPTSVQQWTLFF